MQIDKDKIAEMVLALLHLTSFEEHSIIRTWKGQDWDTMNRLHEKGFISDPRSKAKSVVFSDEGAKRSMELFKTFFEQKE